MKNELEVMRKKAEQLLNSKRKEPKSIEGKVVEFYFNIINVYVTRSKFI